MDDFYSPANVAFGVALAFLFGILAAALDWNISLVATAIGTAGIAWFFIEGDLSKEFFLFVCIFLSAVFYYHFYQNIQASRTSFPFGKQISFAADIIAEPKISGTFEILTVRMRNPYSGELQILAPPDPDLQYGNSIKVTGSIEQSETRVEDPVIFSPHIVSLSNEGGFWLQKILIQLKTRAIGEYKKLFSTDEASLLGAFVFGETSGMSSNLKQSLKASNSSFILSFFGYKLSVFVIMFETLLYGWLSRRSMFLVLLIFLVLFVMMTGFQVSAVRAGIMISLLLLARLIGRPYTRRNPLAFTAAIMVLFAPTLITDLGFIMTFLCLCGAYGLATPLKNLLSLKEGGVLEWRTHTIMTFATILPIVPLIASLDGQFSLTSFAANVLLVIALPAVMVFGIFIFLVSTLSSFAAFILAQCASVILSYQLFIIHMAAAFALPVSIPFGNALFVSAYYLGLIFFAYHYGKIPRSDF